MAVARWTYIVDIYEPSVGFDYPVVEHRFHGKTKAEALAYFQAHMKTDSFLRGCVEKSRWERVPCRATQRWASH